MSEENTARLRAIAGGLTHQASELRKRRRGRFVDDVLAQLDEAISEVPPDDWPALAVALAARLATIASLMLSPVGEGDQQSFAEEGGDRYITTEQAAELAGVSRRWINRHTRGQRFRKNLSRKQVRLHEAGFRRWLEARTTRSAVS